MKLISTDINGLIRKIFCKKDPIFAEIMINWSKIVGSKFSATTSPVKISYSKEKGAKVNILYISSTNSGISLEMSFQQEIIIERIAVYLGFKAVHRIKMISI